MTLADRPFDTGLQPERTLLAWRRTTLALAVASTLEVRLAMDQLGELALVLGGIGLVLAGATYVGATVRYRRMHRSLVADATRLPVGGRSLAALALSAVVLAGTAMAAIILAALP